MDSEKRRLRDEVAELTRAVGELREQLAQQAVHHCGGCRCFHYHFTPLPTYPVTPYVITYGSTTTTTSPTISGGHPGSYTVSNAGTYELTSNSSN